LSAVRRYPPLPPFLKLHPHRITHSFRRFRVCSGAASGRLAAEPSRCLDRTGSRWRLRKTGSSFRAIFDRGNPPSNPHLRYHPRRKQTVPDDKSEADKLEARLFLSRVAQVRRGLEALEARKQLSQSPEKPASTKPATKSES